MILVDTSIWIAHLRTGVAALTRLLDAGRVVTHPWVVGEIALGRLRHRGEVLGLLAALPQAPVATAEELLAFIERADLPGSGVGYVDAQLLAATRLAPGTSLWTGDRRLAGVARRLDIAFQPT